MFLLSLYSSFFPSPTNPKLYNSTNIRATLYQNGGSWIFNCYFFNLFHSNGAAVYYANCEIKLLIEDSIFFNCTTTGSGGAIYFSTTLGHIALFKICGYRCGGPFDHGQFAIVYSNISLSTNVNLTSFSYCSYFFSKQYSPLMLQRCSPLVSSINSSYNSLEYHCGLCFYQSYSKICFSTVFSNFAEKGSCIRIFSGSSHILCTNIVNNSFNGFSFYVIYQESNAFTNITNCNFIDNVPYLFRANNTMIIRECWIQSNYIVSGSCSMSNINQIQTFKLSHLHTFMCYSLNWLYSHPMNHIRNNSFIFIVMFIY